MMTGIIGRANTRAQRRFAAMLDAHVIADPWARETRLYAQAERLMDSLIEQARWEHAKAELDAVLEADPEYVAWLETELRMGWGDR